MKPLSVVGLACAVSAMFLLHPFASNAAAVTTLYSFCNEQNCKDGTGPNANLVNVDGLLYGTTFGGGANCSRYGDCGTVFALDPKTGTETVVHAFGKGNDGFSPQAGLVYLHGLLYGTTWSGGAYKHRGGGTVYAVDPVTGAETVLYSFCSEKHCRDGRWPYAVLTEVKGILYSTTALGGANAKPNCLYGCGTVFEIDPKTGAERVVYSFCSQKSCTDGAAPHADLINVKGTLYGTATDGGAYDGLNGPGTVFSLDPDTGAERVLYSFCSQSNCADGGYPYAGVINVKGTLYGTALYGGSETCNAGCGTAFALDLKTGVETTVYSFCGELNCRDGAYPGTTFIDVNGDLYGTTGSGGRKIGKHRCDFGCGTVFSLRRDTRGEKVLYRFCSERKCRDGQSPGGSLIDVNGTLYGTTFAGGAHNAGTIFSIVP